jgi:hypothetical protein
MLSTGSVRAAPAILPPVDFEFTHEIPAPLPDVSNALLDEAYQRSLADLSSLADRELLEQEETGGGSVHRRVRCVLEIQLNSTARRFIGDGDPAWIEDARWDPETQTWSWTIEPEVGGGLLEARGEISLEDASDHTTRRHVTGIVKVSVPLYGGKVENIIVGGLERAYDEEAQRLTEWVKRG